ncbi:MAG: hypothetical protein NUV65_00235 [Candidatus Roizmanbacteria bacterium]|nr:hypothetical protein [Candidatus Roizmanbacteria bacterium]
MPIESLLPISPLQLDRNVAQPPFTEALQQTIDTQAIGAMTLTEIERITADIWPQQPIPRRSQTAHELTDLYDACSLRAEELFRSKIDSPLFKDQPNAGRLHGPNIFYFLRHGQTEEMVYQPAGFDNLVRCVASGAFAHTLYTTEFYVVEGAHSRTLGVTQILHPDWEDSRPVIKIRQAVVSILGDQVSFGLNYFTVKNNLDVYRANALLTAPISWD